MNLLIITPTLNNSPYLEETIASVRNYAPGAEHILSAPSGEVAALRARYPDLRVVVDQGREGGMYGAINAGIEAAQTDWQWFTYINDDDVLAPGFTRMLEAQQRDQAPPGFVYGVVTQIDAEGAELYPISVCPWASLLSYLFPSQVSPISQQGMLIQRAALDQVGLLDSSFKYAGDMELWCRLYTSGVRFEFYNQHVAGFRVWGSQLSKDQQPFEVEKVRIRELYFSAPHPLVLGCVQTLFRLYNIPNYIRRIRRLGWKTSDQVMRA
jgi:GT2 family glycosyltransferase